MRTKSKAPQRGVGGSTGQWAPAHALRARERARRRDHVTTQAMDESLSTQANYARHRGVFAPSAKVLSVKFKRDAGATRERPPFGTEQTYRGKLAMSASLIGRLGSSAFRLSTNSSVDVAHGLALLFGLGTKALVWGFLSQAG